jgi:hypothetical protein
LKIAENVTYLFKEKGILGKIESAVENIAVQIEKGVHSITADVSHRISLYRLLRYSICFSIEI